METMDTRIVLKTLMDELHEDFDQREDFQRKADKRLKIWLWVIGIGLMTVGSYLFWLMLTMNQNMALMTQSVQQMTGDVSIMRREFQKVSINMTTMATDLHGMKQDMTVITSSVQQMSKDMNQMNIAVYNMNRGVTWMSHDVNKLSRPWQMMRSVFPF
jgi:uncharacterized protein YoxC